MAFDSQKYELRLFVSSTFRDLMPEREELVKKIFPLIRRSCRARGVEFTEIDLRWGITEEESRSGKTIRICLEEIDRCRPYFIGIIGSRYGWIPGITEVGKDEEMLREFPWLREYAEQDKSIIEMEFAHGAVLQKNDSAFFYEQVQSSLPKKEGEQGLEDLKKSIFASGLPLRSFVTPAELGEQVFQDIVAILDRDFPARKDLTPLERERIEHEAYARNRLQSYVPNPEYYKIFEERVNSTGAPLVIWGKSGLGKSALMAYLAHEYKTRHPEAFVIQHFIGAAEGSDPEDVMRQVIMEIKERYQLADTIPSDDNALREEFPVWLAKVHDGDKLILLIDALNQLTGIAPELHWLPDFIPANVRLVLSTTTGSLPLEELRNRKWNALELKPLTAAQRESIALNFLERYGKSLPQEELHALAANPKSSSPLFLRTVLEELRIFGHYQSLHDELEEYLSSADDGSAPERELFQKVLARLERDHGAGVVKSVMTAIWASRHGLSESELIEISGLTRMTLSVLMTSMEYHLMVREGFHTFFHNYLREAIELRYLPEDRARKAAHVRLGEYFGTREFGHRRMNEEPWQWQAAQENEKLKHSLLAPEMLALLETQHEQYEAFGYWRAFDRIALDSSYIPRLTDPSLDSETVVEAFTNAVDLIVLSSAYAQADEFFLAGYPVVEHIEMDAEHRLSIREKRILILNHLGKYEEVIELADAMLKDPGIIALPKLRINMLDHISYAFYYLGKFEEAEKLTREAIEECEKLYGARSAEIISRLNTLASVLLFQSRFEEAEEYFQRIIGLVEEQFGATHTEMARARTQLAAYYNKVGRFNDAGDEFAKAEAIFLRTVGREHYLTCICRQQFAAAKLGLNDIAFARTLYISVVDAMLKKHGPLHRETATSGIGIGYTYYLEENYEAAIPYYERFLPYFEETHGADNPETIKRRNRLEEMREKVKSSY